MKATATASNAKACVAPVGEMPASTNSASASASCVDHQPAATPAEPRQVEAVHQRRPQELEGVGQADQAQEADGGHVEPFDRQPGLHRLPGERQRQPRRKAEHGDDDEAVQRGNALRSRARQRVGGGSQAASAPF